MYYSCHEKHHIKGTGFLVSKRAKHLVMDFKALSPQMAYLRVKGRFFNLSILNAHAPTEDKPTDEKEDFYDKLEKALDECPQRDIKIIIGDMNAQVGREPYFSPTIGKHSLHLHSNENGEHLINFAASHDMVIGGTLFPHKNIHKATWKHPNGRTNNQIDHVLISARHKSNLLDVRTYKGANVDSDHFLVASRLRFKISNAGKTKRSKITKFNTSKLQVPETKMEFQTTLNRIAQCDTHDINSQWTACKKLLTTAALETLGKETPIRRNHWFDSDCAEVTKKKNELYQNTLQQGCTRQSMDTYRETRKREKKLHRKKKREYLQKEIKEAEALRLKNESRLFYKKVNNMRAEFKPKVNICKDENGVILSEKPDILRRWVRHFDTVLNNNSAEVEHITVESTGDDLHIDNVELPSLEEVKQAVRQLKNNKSPGSDELVAELFKAAGEEFIQYLHNLTLKVWTEEEMPEEWRLGIVCPLHKKGDQLECCNYRGITLLNTGYKIMSNILYKRLLPLSEKIIGNYQCGFRPGKSCIDQIFSLRQILEKTLEYNVETHHLFVDFKAAYDSINRNALYNAMSEFGIPRKLINLVKLTMSPVTCRVRVGSDLSEPFEALHGVRQGDGLACLLFNLALEKVIRDSGIEIRATIFENSVQLLAYADDIDIIAKTPDALHDAFTNLEISAKNMGLVINQQKTKYMAVGCTQQIPTLSCGNQNFETVPRFTYLGSLITNNNDTTEEIQKRIMNANRCYFRLQNLIKSRLLSRNTKILVYKTLIRPVLTYAAETWVLTKRNERALDVFERKILRRIFGPVLDNGFWRRRYNNELYTLFNEPNVTAFIKLGRLRWLGHVERMTEHQAPKSLLHSRPIGRRSLGRPKLRWSDNVFKDISTLELLNWRELALNRDEWRKILEEAKTHQGL